MKAINRKQLFLITLGLGVAVTIGLIVVIAITVRDIKIISSDIHEKRTELEKNFQTGLSLRESIRQLDAIEPSLATIRTAFIQREETLVFVSELENEANKLRLEQTISIPELDNTKELSTTPIQLTVRGSAANVLAYINILDSKPFYININAIELSNPQGDTQGQLVTAQIQATLFWN